MMEQIIDQAWTSLLASVMKKREVLRPEIGDEIDLYLPQSKLLSLIESNPSFASQLYLSAQSSARRNANNIMRKLGMPADYFWKFEYWPKARAFTTLEKLVKRVFSSMMTHAKEGNLEITALDVEPLRINVDFKDCVECAGIARLEYGICYYHAGVLSGILSGLINRDFDAFETDCCARGNESCRFVIGDKEDEEIKSRHNAYISAPEIRADLTSRLEATLNNLPARALGNLVDINYHQLVTASMLLNEPERFAPTNFEAGAQLGHKLAPVLAKRYGEEGLKILSDCLRQMRCSFVGIEEGKTEVKLVIKECADSAGQIKAMEMMSFLFGELQALTSELTKTEMVLKESHFDGDNIALTFTAKS